MERSELLLEATKLLSTINSGVIVVSIAFLKDLFKERAQNKTIRWAWAMLMLSTIFCVGTISTTSASEPSMVPIAFAISISIIGISIVMYFVLISVEKSEDINKESENKGQPIESIKSPAPNLSVTENESKVE